MLLRCYSFFLWALILMGVSAAPAQPAIGTCTITEYGAVGDGETPATAAVQAALDACAEAGGGTVVVPPGRFLIAPVQLRSHVTLHVGPGATLVGSRDPDDYPMVRPRWDSPFEAETHAPLISGKGLRNVAITGTGTIDGDGEVWWYNRPTYSDKVRYGRARLIVLEESERIRVRDVTLQNSPRWTLLITNNPEHSINTDGIAINSSRNVRIANNYITTGDDGIVIKAGRYRPERGAPSESGMTENVVITNNVVAHAHGGVVLGGEMAGGIRNVTVSNCVFQDTDRGIRIKSNRVDRAGFVNGLYVSNVVMDGVLVPITMNMYYYQPFEPHRREPVTEATPAFRNISITDVLATNVQSAGFMAGLPESPIEGVTFRNVRILGDDGAEPIPQGMRNRYFLERWFQVQNVRGLTFENVEVDMGPGLALTFADVEDLDLTRFQTTPRAEAPVVELRDVHGVAIRELRVPADGPPALLVAGVGTRAVTFEGAAAASAPVVVAEDVPAGAVRFHD